MLTFGAVLEGLKRTDVVMNFRRKGWNGKGMYIYLVLPLPVYGQRPYIQLKDAQGMLVPWLASQTDLLSEDWEEAI